MEDEEFDGQVFIDALDQGIDDALVRFGDQVGDAEKQLLGKVQARLADMDLTAGKIKKSVENLRAINDVRKELNAARQDGKYAVAVQNLVGQFAVQAQVLDGYFTTLRIGYGRGTKLYGAIVEEYITATVAELYTGAMTGLDAPLMQIIRTHVTTGAPIAELRSQVGALFSQDKVLSQRAETIADNALNQFSRNYMQAVSDDLGLKHYFFKGTIIKTSRPFCVERTGKYYTEDEVLAWGDLSFAGKIKGTDRSNIKTNLGGNRCRHRLVPITETLYDKKTGRSGQLGLFK